MTAAHLTSVGSGSGEWQTPPELFRTLDRRWGFTLDAWADHHNALCDLYATVDGVYRKSALPARLGGGPKLQYKTDGFGMPWAGRRVFGNPPFSRGLIDRCVQKYIDEAQRDFGRTPEAAVYIIPSAPDTRWYQALEEVAEIQPLPRRVKFIHPPFPCQEKCRERGHREGKPLPSPPGPICVAELRVLRRHWLGVLLPDSEPVSGKVLLASGDMAGELAGALADAAAG